MRDPLARECGPKGQFCYVLGVRRTHDRVRCRRHIHEQLVERNILLRVRSDQIVKLQAGNGKHRLTIQLRIVQAIQQMNAAGTRGRETTAQSFVYLA